MTTEDIAVGASILVEVQRQDGSTSLHLGEYVGCSLSEVVVRRHSWVAATGRRHLFLAGEPDGDYEVEVSDPSALTRLPRWGAIVQDWPHPLPAESR